MIINQAGQRGRKGESSPTLYISGPWVVEVPPVGAPLCMFALVNLGRTRALFPRPSKVSASPHIASPGGTLLRINLGPRLVGDYGETWGRMCISLGGRHGEKRSPDDSPPIIINSCLCRVHTAALVWCERAGVLRSECGQEQASTREPVSLFLCVSEACKRCYDCRRTWYCTATTTLSGALAGDP